MLPPISLTHIGRDIEYQETRKKLYIVSEGTLTEPYFLESILSSSPYLSSCKNFEFYKTERSGRDFGVNTIEGMISIAYKNIIDNKSVRFRKKKDKVIIFFDLDIYHDSFAKIKKLIEDNKKFIIFVFVNPAIELFLLLCKENSFEEIIALNKEKILKNEKNPSTGKRFIHQLVIDTFGVDPKDSSADFSLFANGLQNAINQEKLYLSSKLVNPDENLISNFGKIIEKIRDGDLENVDYSFFN